MYRPNRAAGATRIALRQHTERLRAGDNVAELGLSGCRRRYEKALPIRMKSCFDEKLRLLSVQVYFGRVGRVAKTTVTTATRA
jgi:hypothetical protein